MRGKKTFYHISAVCVKKKTCKAETWEFTGGIDIEVKKNRIYVDKTYDLITEVNMSSWDPIMFLYYAQKLHQLLSKKR